MKFNYRILKKISLLVFIFVILSVGFLGKFALAASPSPGFPVCFGADSVINKDDVVAWAGNYKLNKPLIDIVKDSIVNSFEFVYLASRWGQSCMPPSASPLPTATPGASPPPGTGFNFISWSDVQGTTASYFITNSTNAKKLVPEFTIFNGDLCSSGFSVSCTDAWKAALNGGTSPGNGMSNITFPVRGNHDDADAAGWSAYFNMNTNATNVGAKNFTTDPNAPDRTYSFDYGNSHFVGLDVPGAVNLMSASTITWLRTDLQAVKDNPARGIVHVFLFFHGAVYYVDGHASTPPANLISILNDFPMITATFHGHEHVKAYVFVNSSRISTLTHPFLEIVSAVAGSPGLHYSPNYDCNPARYNATTDWCVDLPGENTFFTGFANVTVTGPKVDIDFYDNSNVKRKSISVSK